MTRDQKPINMVFAGHFSFLFVAVAGVCALLIYSALANQRSIETQQSAQTAHLAALDLDEAIDDLQYYGAELSNTLSDESYDAFLAASFAADAIIRKITDKPLRNEVHLQKNKLVNNTYFALHAYLAEDRAQGDKSAHAMQSAARRLNEIVQANVEQYRTEQLRAERAIVQRTNFAINVTILATIIASLAFTPPSALAHAPAKLGASVGVGGAACVDHARGVARD